MTDSSPTLHVVTPPDPHRGGIAAGELLYGAIAGAASEHDRALILGRSTDRLAAIGLGVGDPQLTPVPRLTVATASVIRRAAKTCRADRVVLWSRELLVAAPGVHRGGTRVEAHLLDGPGVDETDPWRPGARALGAIDRFVVPDSVSRWCWADAGVDVDRIKIARFQSPLLRAGRAEAREWLDLGETPTLAPLIADPRRVDARALAFVSGVLELLGIEHVLVLPEGCERFAEAVRFRQGAGLRTRYAVVPAPLLEALPAADVLIAPRHDGGRSTVDSLLDSIASSLGSPVAYVAGWNVHQGLGHGMLSPDIRENVSPVIEALETANRQAAMRETG